MQVRDQERWRRGEGTPDRRNTSSEDSDDSTAGQALLQLARENVTVGIRSSLDTATERLQWADASDASGGAREFQPIALSDTDLEVHMVTDPEAPAELSERYIEECNNIKSGGAEVSDLVTDEELRATLTSALGSLQDSSGTEVIREGSFPHLPTNRDAEASALTTSLAGRGRGRGRAQALSSHDAAKTDNLEELNFRGLGKGSDTLLQTCRALIKMDSGAVGTSRVP